MSDTVVLELALPFAIVMSFTPGPNNLMLASAGARFGFARTWPHQLGIMIGFAIMMLCVGYAVAALIFATPQLYVVMKVGSFIYILYLAWQIGNAEASASEAGSGRPLGFLAAAAFQWINPKAWIMALTAMATYRTRDLDAHQQIFLLTLMFAIIGAASSSAWVFFGQMIRRYLTLPRHRITFDWTMAILLVGSVVPTIFER